MTLRNAARFTIALAILSIAPACGPKTIYEHEVAYPQGWSYSDTTVFDFAVADLDAAYDLVLELDHGTDYPAENLYVRLHTTFPDGRRTSDRVSLELAGEYGVWNGDCSAERCDFSVPILSGTRFKEAGDYRLVVEQFSRRETVEEVRGVGLRVIVSE